MVLQFDENGRIIIPELEKRLREEKHFEKEKIKENEEIIAYWETLNFHCGNFFQEMNFLGGITGRRNRYYLYKNKNLFMLSSGFSEEKLTRINLFLPEEVDFFTDFLIKEYKKNNIIGAPIGFILDYLKETYNEIPLNLTRLRIIVDLNIKGLDEKNYLYSFTLAMFYILSILKKDFSLSMDRRKFILEEREKERENLNNIYKECIIRGYDRKRIVFERENFYFVASFNKPFRGICYVYDKREIDHIITLLNHSDFYEEDIWKDKIEINCFKVLRHINQEQNNICLVCYREIMMRNQRNKRQIMEYTDSRLKLAFKIIKLIKGGLVIDKDGRKYHYFKRK